MAIGSAPALLKIGEVCERVGLSHRTVRYYEEVELLTPAARTPGGFRLFSEEDVTRLEILKGMKPFGLSLEEIRELMALLDATAESTEAGDERRARLAHYGDRAEERIGQLRAHTAEVRRLRARIAGALRS
jgi:DNA-binding transcriptional MerR regulator